MSAENEMQPMKMKNPNSAKENKDQKVDSIKIKSSFAEKEERSRPIQSNEAIFFKVINSEQEFLDFQKGNMQFSFQPLFSLQLFSNELINGYKNLKILISLTPKYFFPHIRILFDKQFEIHDNLEETLQKFYGDLYLTDDKKFIELLNAELKDTAKPKGKLILKEKEKEIYFIDIIEDNFIRENNSYQHLFKFFIDGASFSPLETNFWYYFLTIQSKPEENNWITLGFTTLKNFHKEYNKYISMISQFLIIPKFKRQGLGKFLLKSIYEYLIKDECCIEITTEDPCMEFVFLRDVTLSELILKYNFLDPFLKSLGKKYEIKTKDVYAKFPLEKAFVTEITNKFKFQKNFILRALEIMLYSICGNDIVNEFFQYKKESLAKILQNKYNLGFVSKNARKGPFIEFWDGPIFNYEKLIEDEKKESCGDLTIPQQVESYFLDYNNDVKKILPKVGKMVLDYKKSMTK